LAFGFFSAAVLFPSLGRFVLSRGDSKKAPVVSFSSDKVPGAWWENIGGCGVGGGGGGGGSARWMGRGVTGGLVNLDLMSTTTLGGDYEYKSFSARLSKNISRYSMGFSFPWVMKEGTHQFRTDESANTVVMPTTQRVGGMGNLGADFSCKFGEIQSGSATLSLGLPTAQYNHRRFYNYDDDLMRGQTKDKKYYVPPELQTGNGLYSSTASVDYTIDRDWGPIALGVSYTSQFRNLSDLAKMGAQNKLFQRVNGNSRRYVDFKGSDANPQDAATYAGYTDVIHAVDAAGKDLGVLIGDFFGNSASVHAAAAYKEETFVHSLQFDYSYKLKKDWYVRQEYSGGSPTVDAATLQRIIPIRAAVSDIPHFFAASYGLEFSHLYFPVFLAGTLGFNTKEIVNYTGTIGVKGSFF
jgi:hypothetical protein